MTRSLRWKLTGSYLVLVLFSLAVAAAVLIPPITRVYLDAYRRSVLNEAKSIALVLGVYQAEGASIDRLDDIASGSSWRDGVYVGVKDVWGRPPATGRWAGVAAGDRQDAVGARGCSGVRREHGDFDVRTPRAKGIHGGSQHRFVPQVVEPVVAG